MSWRKRLLIGAAIVLSLSGGIVTAHLLQVHVVGRTSGSLLGVLCGAGGSNCERVLNSRWSVLPPRPKIQGPAAASRPVRRGAAGSSGASSFRLPVPVLGLAYFAFLSAWFIGVGCPNRLGWRWQLVPFVVLLLGNAGSAVFIYVMASVLKAWCTACLAVHAINFLLLLIVIVTCPRRFRATPSPEPAGIPVASVTPDAVVAHPSCRLAGVTIALAIAIWLTGALAAIAVAYYSRSVMLDKVVNGFATHPDLLAALHMKQEKHEIGLRPDDPSRGSSDAPVTLVIFSDMTCSNCAKFESFLDEQIEPLFGDRLRIVFKHFALSGRCNRLAAGSGSNAPCTAAFAAEAARLQGGSESFWKMLREIRAQADDLASLDYAATAARLGMDPKRLVEDMGGVGVRERVERDAELGGTLGIDATPTVFVNGRAVPVIAQDNLAFWKSVAASAAGGTSGEKAVLSVTNPASDARGQGGRR